MIEILEGVFFDPAKEWYKQDYRLIELGQEVMASPPISEEIEESGARQRLLWAKWNHTTDMGNFDMLVSMHYLYSIDSRAFMGKSKHDSVSINKTA